METCKSGEVLYSAEFAPSEKKHHPSQVLLVKDENKAIPSKKTRKLQ